MTIPSAGYKEKRGRFLRRNPFEHPLTLGFFYREKMRAIHAVAPDEPFQRILEVGGGRGGLTALLYPRADITNIDLDFSYATAPANSHDRIRFICGDATTLPFPAHAFDAVTMFDLLEHVPDDAAAVREGLRVLRPGGVLMISSPNERWRFPFYPALKPICPPEEEMFARWGHVRRGYSVDDLRRLIGLDCERSATFITEVTVIGHDVAFSRLPRLLRRSLCTLLAPLTWTGYLLHDDQRGGTETVTSWRKAHG